MYSLKRWMVGLDLTEMDENIIQHTAFLANIIKPEKIYFIHVYGGDSGLDDLKAEFPELEGSSDEKLEVKMKEVVESSFTDVNTYGPDYDVVVGSPFEEMLKWDSMKDIDLLITGRKKELSGSGILPQQLARKVRSSIYFVPEGTTPKLNKVMVSLDFSENSVMAFEEGVSLASASGAKLNTLNSYSLPSGFYKTGKSEEEFAKIMKENAKKKCNEVIDGVDTKGVDVNQIYRLDSNGDHSDVINDVAHEENMDLIVIGAKGRTQAAAFFLGSVTEKVIRRDVDIPLLVVKDKKKTFDFFEMLKKI